MSTSELQKLNKPYPQLLAVAFVLVTDVDTDDDLR
jgi:hypothetical protein